MKKCLLVIVLLLALILSGCATKPAENKMFKAMILLPDGNTVKGDCSEYMRISDNWIYLMVNGISYRINDWRVVIIEE